MKLGDEPLGERACPLGDHSEAWLIAAAEGGSEHQDEDHRQSENEEQTRAVTQQDAQVDRVRWKTGDVPPWSESFKVKTQAVSFESELRSAARKSEAFSLATGRPVSWGVAQDATTWFTFSLAYVDSK